MKIGLELCNSERETVAKAAIILEDCRYAPPEIRQIFSDKILEYNWQEDQSIPTAILILRDAVAEISNGIIDYNDVKLLNAGNEDAIKLIESNFIKGIKFDDLISDVNSWSTIILGNDYEIDSPMCDYYVKMIKEDGEDVR